MQLGTLFIVATPIGNLQDISLRALKTLFTVDVIACEDTRRTGLLLQKLQEEYGYILEKESIEAKKPRFVSYYDQIELQRIPEVIAALRDGLTIALVSDAGTPLISDPGFKLVRQCIKEGIPVESVPGPSSVVTALTQSGLPSDKFLFLGYLPKKPGHRQDMLEKIKELAIKTTVIFFEAPHRVKGTLEELENIFGSQITIVLTRELTKVHEEILNGTIAELQDHFKKTEPKGEFVVLFNLQEQKVTA